MTNWLPTPVGDEFNLHIIEWGPGANSNDTFVAVARGDLVDRSVQVEGTFQTGTSATLVGSNDGTNFHALHDPFGNVIAITAAGIAQVIEVTAWMKPAITAGTGTESLTFTVCCRMSLKG